ncbi:hypothetical protein ACMFMF_011701 [Clarireedia jacksonii]
MSAIKSNMNNLHIHSISIDGETARQAGVFTTLPIRKSKYDDLANEGALKALKDWNNHAKDDISKHGFRAVAPSISPFGNIYSFVSSEVLPERLAILAYIGDFATIHDDFCEPLTSEENIQQYEKLERCWTTEPHQFVAKSPSELKLYKALSEALLDLIKIDRQSGIRIIDLYQKWIMNGGRVPKMTTYDEFMVHRSNNDFGTAAWWAMVEFGIGLNLTLEERMISNPITDTASEFLVLSQDYWSWEKEYRAYKADGTRLMSAIDFISRKESIPIELAKRKVKERILYLEQKFLRQKTEIYHSHTHISAALNSWIESLGLSIGSYHYWAATSPRYHGWKNEPDSKKKEIIPNIPTENLLRPRDPHLSLCSSTKETFNSSCSDEKQTANQYSDSSNSKSATETGTHDELSISIQPALTTPWKKLDDSALATPCQYIRNLPSKGMRSMLVTALNEWLHAPRTSTVCIDNVIRLLHDASLLIDDIQDNSAMRRGKPAAHTIFGAAQTLNSGLFMFSEAVREARKLSNPQAVDIVLENLETLYLGQSWDIQWKHNLSCPSEDEYLAMPRSAGARF